MSARLWDIIGKDYGPGAFPLNSWEENWYIILSICFLSPFATQLQNRKKNLLINENPPSIFILLKSGM
jgi:hypothetical protein